MPQTSNQAINRPELRPMNLVRLVSIGYVAGIFFAVMLSTALVLIGVEAIFVSDLVINRLLPHVLEHQAGFLNLIYLIILTIPRVLYIALPLALAVATYLVLLRRREAHEFTVIAGMGFSARAIVAIALLIGLTGQSISLLVSGYLEPHARRLMDEAVFDIQFAALRDGQIAAGKFYEIEEFAVFAASGRIGEVAKNVFIHRRGADNRYRIIVANHTIRMKVPSRNNIGLILEDATIHDFKDPVVDKNVPTVDEKINCPTCPPTGQIAPLSRMKLNHLFIEFPTSKLPVHVPDGGSISQSSSWNLLARLGESRRISQELSERFWRSLLCFVAPLLALLAMAITTPRTYLVALPAACAMVLAGSFFGSRIIRNLIPIVDGGIFWLLTIATIVTALVLMVLIRRFEHGCLCAAKVRL